MRGDRTLGYFATDLAYIDGGPVLVFEWRDEPAGAVPVHFVSIDPQYLHEINWPQAKFMYEFPVNDPRPLH